MFWTPALSWLRNASGILETRKKSDALDSCSLVGYLVLFFPSLSGIQIFHGNMHGFSFTDCPWHSVIPFSVIFHPSYVRNYLLFYLCVSFPPVIISFRQFIIFKTSFSLLLDLLNWFCIYFTFPLDFLSLFSFFFPEIS